MQRLPEPSVAAEPPPEPADVSVIVPVHRGGDAFRRCLAALAAADPPPAELIVVVDGGGEADVALARAFGARLIVRECASGPAAARNLGARAARGSILFFVDADVVVPPDAIARVAAAFCDHPQITALMGSYDDAPGDPGFLSQYKNLLHHFTHQHGREETFTFWGACGAIRREVFLAAGGFDERYRTPSVEDMELGYRLAGAGYKLRLDKALQVKHLKRWEPGNLLRTDIFGRALPWTELIHRHGTLTNDLNLGISSRLSVVAVFCLLGALLIAPRWPRTLPVAPALATTLLALNAPLYRFFLRKRGLVFTLRALPWHWLYFAYSGLAFAFGTFRARLGHRHDPAP
jgi:GT2 family glycosyltransferase